MKYIILLSSLFVSTLTFAENSNEFLSTSQRKEIVRAIDDVCADTWCEGDYNFKFHDFSCDKKTQICQLSFQFIKSDGVQEDVFSPIQVCRFENIRHVKQLMKERYSLTDSFYDSVSSCIDDKEANLNL